MASDGEKAQLPLKSIPGSYGIPIISAWKDRSEFLKDEVKFFQSRVDRHQSTIVRLNAAPGPFIAYRWNAVAILDAKSYPVLFDTSKVEKKNVFVGLYLPSVDMTGGYRVCAYLDPSDPKHTKIKQLLLNLLVSRKDHVIPEFRSSYATFFRDLDDEMAKSGKFVLNEHNDSAAFEFLGRLFFGVNPRETPLGPNGVKNANLWLFAQLCPIMYLGLPSIIEDLLIHTFPIPAFLLKSKYKPLYEYVSTAAKDALAMAEKLGLDREEAIHNLIFAAFFNALGGMKVLFPGVLSFIAKAGKDLHSRLASEIRAAVSDAGGVLTVAALEKMELTKSVVYESLRMDPPVKYQYAIAKKDIIIESHDARYEVKAGEALFGYQPFATKDTRVFGPDAGEFVPDRFMGEQGRRLLQYVLWSNGPETEDPTVANKQCAGKNLAVLSARLLLAEFFLRYDTFTAEIGTVPLGIKVTFTSLTKAKNE